MQCFSCKQKVEFDINQVQYFHIEKNTIEIVHLGLLTIHDSSNMTILTYCIQSDFLNYRHV